MHRLLIGGINGGRVILGLLQYDERFMKYTLPFSRYIVEQFIAADKYCWLHLWKGKTGFNLEGKN